MTIVPYAVNALAPFAGQVIRQVGNDLYNKYGSSILAERQSNQEQLVKQLFSPGSAPAYFKNRPSTTVSRFYNSPRMLVRYSKKPTKRRIPQRATTVLIRQPKAEIKSDVEDDILAATVSTTGLIGLASAIAAGTALGDRNGSVTKMLDLKLHVQLFKNAGNDPYIIHRVIVFRWNQGFTSPTVTSVLDTAAVDSTYNSQDARTFNVLYDRVFNQKAGAGVATAYAADGMQIPIYVKLNYQVNYSSTSGTSHDRSVWVICISSSANGTVNVNGQARFIDL